MSPLLHALADAVRTAAPAEPLGLVQRMVRFLQEGGPWMLVNLFWLAVALAVALERFLTLVVRYSLNAGPFMEQVSKLVLTGNVDRAVKLCSAAPNAPLARVVRAGLTEAHRGEVEVARAVAVALAEHTPRVQARISWLASLGHLATLVGLAGASFGLIGALRALGGAPEAQRHTLVAEGVAGALTHVAFALTIAAVCVLLHLLLASYARRMVEAVRLHALRLESLLARRAAGRSGAQGDGSQTPGGTGLPPGHRPEGSGEGRLP